MVVDAQAVAGRPDFNHRFTRGGEAVREADGRRAAGCQIDVLFGCRPTVDPKFHALFSLGFGAEVLDSCRHVQRSGHGGECFVDTNVGDGSVLHGISVCEGRLTHIDDRQRSGLAQASRASVEVVFGFCAGETGLPADLSQIGEEIDLGAGQSRGFRFGLGEDLFDAREGCRQI